MSAVVESQALTDLLARAGAPDTERPRWIAERMAGVTATEVRDLHIGAVSVQALIDMKLGRTPEPGDLSHIPVIGWGREREAVIAEALRGVGIEPESRVFHGVNNSRHLASPDGIGVDFDDALIVSEIKTSGKPLPLGSLELARKGYVHQMQWVMHVTGAVRCRFVVEERIEVAKGVFVPGPLHEDWVDRDEVAIAELVKVADAFLTELDRQREEGAPVIDEELDTHAVNYLRALELEREAKALKAPAWAAMLAAAKSQVSALARVTYSPPKPVEVEDIDYAAARENEAGAALYAAFQEAQDAWQAYCEGFRTVRTVEGKPSLRVTAVKGMKE